MAADDVAVRRAALIGNPVAHSRSPAMHNAAFAATRISAVYELWRTELEEMPARFDVIRQPDMLGANVTVPYKQVVMAHCDELTDTARRVGAVNTIIPTANGLTGENTDAYGFATSVREARGPSSFRRALVIGAGGASRAIVVALHDLGVEEIVIANRTVARATVMAEDLAAAGIAGIATIGLHQLDVNALRNTDIIVNATSIGWHDESLPISEELLRALPVDALVADLTYQETALLRVARTLERPVMDGLGMLLHQGARAFELWTGIPAPVEVMRAALIDSVQT